MDEFRPSKLGRQLERYASGSNLLTIIGATLELAKVEQVAHDLRPDIDNTLAFGGDGELLAEPTDIDRHVGEGLDIVEVCQLTAETGLGAQTEIIANHGLKLIDQP